MESATESRPFRIQAMIGDCRTTATAVAGFPAYADKVIRSG